MDDSRNAFIYTYNEETKEIKKENQKEDSFFVIKKFLNVDSGFVGNISASSNALKNKKTGDSLSQIV